MTDKSSKKKPKMPRGHDIGPTAVQFQPWELDKTLLPKAPPGREKKEPAK